MRYFLVFFVALSISGAVSAQISPAGTKSQAAAVHYAEKASLRALDFTQGDIESLLDARNDFTPEGWTEFMKKLDGWLDDKGAPKLSSNFSPSGEALDVRRKSGEFRLTIPGILKQESRNQFGGVSTTAYRAEIDVQLSGKPMKIEHMIQRTCGGANTVTSCR